MNPRGFLATVTLAATLALAPAARAAVDAFIWFEDIHGESTDPGHPGWIEIDSFQLGLFRDAASTPSTIGSATRGAGAGKVKFNEFTIKKTTDAASPSFFRSCTSGKHYPEVKLHVRKAGGSQHEYLVFTLKDVMLSSYQKGGSLGPNTESARVTFASATLENPPAEKLSLTTGAVAAVEVQGQITGVSASAPQFGLNATATIASTASCKNARIDWGDGTANDTKNLTGTSTPLPAHSYSSPGIKTIRVGGPDATYWRGNAPQARPQGRQGDCTGEAQTQITLRLALAPGQVPVVR